MTACGGTLNRTPAPPDSGIHFHRASNYVGRGGGGVEAPTTSGRRLKAHREALLPSLITTQRCCGASSPPAVRCGTRSQQARRALHGPRAAHPCAESLPPLHLKRLPTPARACSCKGRKVPVSHELCPQVSHLLSVRSHETLSPVASYRRLIRACGRVSGCSLPS